MMKERLEKTENKLAIGTRQTEVCPVISITGVL